MLVLDRSRAGHALNVGPIGNCRNLVCLVGGAPLGASPKNE